MKNFKYIDFDNNVAFIEIFKNSINNDKSIFNLKVNFERKKLNART